MNASPQISAVVPARNEEANIARAVESLAEQPEIREIIVVNDQSSDRTGAILADLAARFLQLRVITNDTPPPQGWTGKNWAISLGVAEACGEWLLFTDADVTHLPASAARALADAEHSSAALVSYSPEQEMRAWWERAVIPFIYCRLAAHYSYVRVNDPASPSAAANGQYLLIRRDAYDSLGGHKTISGELVEDVALARRAKQAGLRLHFASGQGIARTRMYGSFSSMWEGWKKNIYVLVGHHRSALFRELAVVVPWIPLILLLLGRWNLFLPIVGLALLVGRHAGYALELRRNRFPRSGIVYYLCGVLFYAAVLLASAWNYARGAVIWKGREYSVNSR